MWSLACISLYFPTVGFLFRPCFTEQDVSAIAIESTTFGSFWRTAQAAISSRFQFSYEIGSPWLPQ